jgi:hypothetical protein
VRRILIDKFDERAIKPGEPMAMLNMPLHARVLHHRYSLESLAKYVGGMDFTSAARRRRGADACCRPPTSARQPWRSTLRPSELTVPSACR